MSAEVRLHPCFYFNGLASEEELLAHLAKLKQQDEAKAKQQH